MDMQYLEGIFRVSIDIYLFVFCQSENPSKVSSTLWDEGPGSQDPEFINFYHYAGLEGQWARMRKQNRKDPLLLRKWVGQNKNTGEDLQRSFN